VVRQVYRYQKNGGGFLIIVLVKFSENCQRMNVLLSAIQLLR
jgi:hypothetical protein